MTTNDDSRHGVPVTPPETKHTEVTTTMEPETVGGTSTHHTTCAIYPGTAIATYLPPGHEEVVSIVFGTEQVHLDFGYLDPLNRLEVAVKEARQRLQARIQVNDMDQAAQQATENDRPGMVYYVVDRGPQSPAESVVPATDSEQDQHVD